MTGQLESINALLGGEGLQKTRSGSIAIEAHPFSEVSEVREFINRFSAEEGWICFTDSVASFNKAQYPEMEGRIILSAEMVAGEQSLHLRQTAQGWTAWIYRAMTAGDDCVVEERLLATAPAARNLQCEQLHLAYEVFWRSQEDELRPYAARFSGFIYEQRGK